MNAQLKEALVLIARQPMIRTVEIADLVDMDPEMVQPMLKPYIDADELIVIPVTAPNGRPANGFMFTKRFCKDPEFRALFDSDEAHVQAQAINSAPAAAPVATAPVKVAPAPAPVPVSEQPAPEHETSKVETATRFIRANGSASTQQLRELLKLGKGQYPLNYLGGAVKAGRLKVVKGQYYLGDKAAQTAPAEKAKPILAKAAKPLAEPHKAEATPVSMRCAIWSDGKIELQRDGQTICALESDEAAFLSSFLLAQRGQHHAIPA